jgi:hypothetical protein
VGNVHVRAPIAGTGGLLPLRDDGRILPQLNNRSHAATDLGRDRRQRIRVPWPQDHAHVTDGAIAVMKRNADVGVEQEVQQAARDTVDALPFAMKPAEQAAEPIGLDKNTGVRDTSVHHPNVVVPIKGDDQRAPRVLDGTTATRRDGASGAGLRETAASRSMRMRHRT